MTAGSATVPAGAPYPVRVDAVLEPRLSRWLWLVKWLLLIPHFVVLAFLWIAFTLLSLVAFFAILFTGRYPRALFDFDVGVLRWSWRVHYYGYAALGTDRYPPFTLADVPDYPAHLDVDYPARLSRGLVLVKWWLLAIPQYIVVGVFVGGGIWLSTYPHSGAGNAGWAAGGLVGLLVLIAAVVLLFTGRYPGSLYDFVLGMDRWVLRVAAYAGLMTDRYPPFRLDAGGADPGSLPVGPPPSGLPGGAAVATPGSAPARQPASRGSWTAGRVVSVVVGAVLVLASTGLFSAGGWLLWADRTQRDGGYLWTPSASMSTAGYALTADGIEFQGSGANWALDRVVGTVRVKATATDPGTALFVGVAPTGDAQRYLSGVPYARMGMFGPGMMAGTINRGGAAPAMPPGSAGIWVAQTSGTGTQSLQWQPSRGDWTVVVMRADGGAGVSATLRAAATVPSAGGIAAGLLGGGAVLLVIGGLLIGLAVPRAGVAPSLPGGPPAPPGPEAPAPEHAVGATPGPPPWPGR